MPILKIGSELQYSMALEEGVSRVLLTHDLCWNTSSGQVSLTMKWRWYPRWQVLVRTKWNDLCQSTGFLALFLANKLLLLAEGLGKPARNRSLLSKFPHSFKVDPSFKANSQVAQVSLMLYFCFLFVLLCLCIFTMLLTKSKVWHILKVLYHRAISPNFNFTTSSL